ncbi:hypothetical protein NPIL_682241 [Nephila pilipes]|uniref:Uncharacterized protein n=1 Tax=Nephila pilipes TaxID=299642 RepID=A0A8X6PDM7_NEPPI|nr:hypothetical protein NPIL_682241 [Nephila pilipes]
MRIWQRVRCIEEDLTIRERFDNPRPDETGRGRRNQQGREETGGRKNVVNEERTTDDVFFNPTESFESTCFVKGSLVYWK